MIAAEGHAGVRRALAVRIAGDTRFIPIEYAGRYRDALGVPLPPGIGVVVSAMRRGDPTWGGTRTGTV